MSKGRAVPGPQPVGDELVAAMEALRLHIEELEQEKHDLQVMLETATEHADHVAESIAEERNDLAMMLKMTTEHADTVEDELHERAAETLRKSAQQLRMIVEATPAPVAISRIDGGEFVYANAMMGALFGVPAQDFLGQPARDLYYDPADREAIIAILEKEQSVDRQEVRFKRPDGTLLWAELSLRLIDFKDEASVLSSLHDITERKRAEQRLQRQVEELRGELDEASQSSELAQSTGTTRFHNLDAAIVEHGTARLVAVHSFRGGNGKSSVAANLAGLLAAKGQRVGVVDADIQSPALHHFLGKAGKKIEHTLNDFLWGNCSVHQLAIDVSADLGQPVSGQLFLIPASVDPGAMARVLSQGYEAQRLTQCFHELVTVLKLDVLLIDTHPGLNEEALLTMRAVHTLIVVLRPDPQDLQGTGITVQVARKLAVPEVLIVINQLPDTRQLQAVRAQVEEAYMSEVVAILPQADEFMSRDGEGLFALRHADHPISVALQHAATKFIGATV